MERDAHWIFGYGSLVWRPDFDYAERRVATLEGYTRRFWQASPDHRGTDDAPGRVATLVAESGALCGGVAYRVAPERWEDTLRALDERESGGFERCEVRFALRGDEPFSVPGLTYVASEGNPNYLGPAPLDEIAVQVRRCRGRSGSNLEYVLLLDDALRSLAFEDEHVSALADRLR